MVWISIRASSAELIVSRASLHQSRALPVSTVVMKPNLDLSSGSSLVFRPIYSCVAKMKFGRSAELPENAVGALIFGSFVLPTVSDLLCLCCGDGGLEGRGAQGRVGILGSGGGWVLSTESTSLGSSL